MIHDNNMRGYKSCPKCGLGTNQQRTWWLTDPIYKSADCMDDTYTDHWLVYRCRCCGFEWQESCVDQGGKGLNWVD